MSQFFNDGFLKELSKKEEAFSDSVGERTAARLTYCLFALIAPRKRGGVEICNSKGSTKRNTYNLPVIAKKGLFDK